MSRSLADIHAFLLDMDGTFFVSETLMDGALETLAELERRGFPYVFLTNNSSARATDYQAKLTRLGIDVGLNRILTSGEATVDYLNAETPYRKVFLLGTPALEAEFKDGGLTLTDNDPDCVVLGFDKTLTYEKLEKACFLVADGLPYIATHPDNTCIVEAGLIPDTGVFIAAIERVTRRLPKVIGKPMPEMVRAALRKLDSKAEHTAMVGDQLDTDMTMAQRSGLFGVLVLSGETSKERLESQSEIRPDMVVDHVGKLLEQIKKLP
jgi:HAD superfamily hydrolase (TIGR01450 family)